jgi:hypothetical protein
LLDDIINKEVNNMAHFAEVNADNIVQRVIVVDNNDCKDAEGNESEAVGAAFCNTLLGGIWKQTSYNGNTRKNYAGIGYTFDEARDAFIPPKPYSKWVLNEDTCNWEAPVAYPEGDTPHIWNDNKGEWEAIVSE